MVQVQLHGIFEKYIKTNWELNVKTVLEAFQAIEANSEKLVKALGGLKEYCSHFFIYVDGKLIMQEYITAPILKSDSKIEVVPVIAGAELSFIITSIIIILLSTAVTYLVTKLLTPKAPKDRTTVSNLFSGYENVTSRGVPIPFGYGRMRMGSVVISNDLNVKYSSIGNATNLTEQELLSILNMGDLT